MTEFRYVQGTIIGWSDMPGERRVRLIPPTVLSMAEAAKRDGWLASARWSFVGVDWDGVAHLQASEAHE